MTKPGIYGFQGDYRWLSNFYPCELEIDGIKYSSLENAYQAQKFTVKDMQLAISLVSPAQSKRIGANYNVVKDWNNKKVAVMSNLLRLKFAQPEFKKKLLATEDLYIEETNTWNDKFWGVCDGEGKNILGHLIMEIREWHKEDKIPF